MVVMPAGGLPPPRIGRHLGRRPHALTEFADRMTDTGRARVAATLERLTRGPVPGSAEYPTAA